MTSGESGYVMRYDSENLFVFLGKVIFPVVLRESLSFSYVGADKIF